MQTTVPSQKDVIFESCIPNLVVDNQNYGSSLYSSLRSTAESLKLCLESVQLPVDSGAQRGGVSCNYGF